MSELSYPFFGALSPQENRRCASGAVVDQREVDDPAQRCRDSCRFILSHEWRGNLCGNDKWGVQRGIAPLQFLSIPQDWGARGLICINVLRTHHRSSKLVLRCPGLEF